MLVEMLTSVAGARFSLQAGDQVQFDEVEARRLIEKGYAVEIVDPDDAPAKSSGKSKTAK